MIYKCKKIYIIHWQLRQIHWDTFLYKIVQTIDQNHFKMWFNSLNMRHVKKNTGWYKYIEDPKNILKLNVVM